jgi:hypothetical protein
MARSFVNRHIASIAVDNISSATTSQPMAHADVHPGKAAARSRIACAELSIAIFAVLLVTICGDP